MHGPMNIKCGTHLTNIPKESNPYIHCC